MVDECKEKGWKAWCWPIKVGSGGSAGQSMWRRLGNLVIVGNQRKWLVNKNNKLTLNVQELHTTQNTYIIFVHSMKKQ